MPKMRNSETDVGKFAQWIGRKCKNHHPLEELGVVGASSRPNMYQSKSKAQVFTIKGRDDVVLYLANGRAFEVTINEVHKVPPEDELVKVTA